MRETVKDAMFNMAVPIIVGAIIGIGCLAVLLVIVKGAS